MCFHSGEYTPLRLPRQERFTRLVHIILVITTNPAHEHKPPTDQVIRRHRPHTLSPPERRNPPTRRINRHVVCRRVGASAFALPRSCAFLPATRETRGRGTNAETEP